MAELAAAVQRLILASQATASLRALAEEVCGVRLIASPAEREDAVRALAGALSSESSSHSGWLAVTAGVLVEDGAGATPLGERLIELLPGVIERATRFGEAALPLALTAEQSSEIDRSTHGLWLGQRFLPEERAQAAARSDPRAAEAWQALGRWCAPAVACFSRDPRLRAAAASRLAGVAALAEVADEVRCLALLLSVLDDEPFVILHPATQQGFRVRVSGVADNFQLQTLLASALIPSERAGWLPWLRPRSGLRGARPDPLAIAVANGEGPQQSEVPSCAVWNLNQWTAIQADGSLPPQVDSAQWIWGEGKPADVLAFEGVRVILLGPLPYPRSWTTCRAFAHLKAGVVVDETFSRAGAREWLRRLGSANEPTPFSGPGLSNGAPPGGDRRR